MFKIDEKTIQNLANIQNLLSQIEVKGVSVEILYKCMLTMQGVLESLEKLNKQEEGIKIDNTKEEKK